MSEKIPITALLQDPEFVLRVKALAVIHGYGKRELLQAVLDHGLIDWKHHTTGAGDDTITFVRGVHELAQ